MKMRSDERAGRVVVCHLTGNLEQFTVAEFRQAVSTLAPGLPVIFDLSDVPFVGSAGLGALIGAVRRLRESGREVALCSPRPAVNRLFNLVRLPRLVGVLENAAAAHQLLVASSVA